MSRLLSMETTTIFHWTCHLQLLWSTGPVQWRQTRPIGKVPKHILQNKTVGKVNTYLCLSDLLWCYLLQWVPPGRATRIDRISISEKHVTLRAVTGADEGSYTVRDSAGDINRKMCLNVRGENTNKHNLTVCASHFWLTQFYWPIPSIRILYVSHNGFLKRQMLMGSCRLMHFRWSVGPLAELWCMYCASLSMS